MWSTQNDVRETRAPTAKCQTFSHKQTYTRLDVTSLTSMMMTTTMTWSKKSRSDSDGCTELQSTPAGSNMHTHTHTVTTRARHLGLETKHPRPDARLQFRHGSSGGGEGRGGARSASLPLLPPHQRACSDFPYTRHRRRAPPEHDGSVLAGVTCADTAGRPPLSRSGVRPACETGVAEPRGCRYVVMMRGGRGSTGWKEMESAELGKEKKKLCADVEKKRKRRCELFRIWTRADNCLLSFFITLPVLSLHRNTPCDCSHTSSQCHRHQRKSLPILRKKLCVCVEREKREGRRERQIK